MPVWSMSILVRILISVSEYWYHDNTLIFMILQTGLCENFNIKDFMIGVTPNNNEERRLGALSNTPCILILKNI